MVSHTTKNVVRRMSLGILERVALRIVRGALNGTISRFTPYQLCIAIEEDRNLWSNTPEAMKQRISGLKNRFRNHFDKFLGELTTSLMVEWLRKDQPYLCNVIMATSKNYKWFDRQVIEYLQMITGM